MLTRLCSPRAFSPGFLSLLLLVALAQPARPAEGTVPTNDEGCPLTDNALARGQKGPRKVGLDWTTGSVFPSRVDHSGKYCFVLTNVNDILYNYDFTVNRLTQEGDDLSLLTGAIGKLSGLTKDNSKAAFTAERAPACGPLLEAVGKAASDLKAALGGLDPGKDAGGKPKSAPLATTLAAWPPVAEKYPPLERAVAQLQAASDKCPLLGNQPDVLDEYNNVRKSYLELLRRVKSPHVARYTAELDNTEGYDVVVQETLEGKPTTAAAKTYHLDPGRKILTASAGFVLTTLQARSYSSVTAPDPADPTTTRTVLSVDGGGGVRPALAALLNYHIPGLSTRQVGLAVSAGPLFDISNGKADTSHFGFFGGPSLHLWNRLYLTPGIHVGEFADLPLGFSQAGQPIPTGMGTPAAQKRYTAHFAFAITFKASELGIGSGNSDTSKKTPATQPKP